MESTDSVKAWIEVAVRPAKAAELGGVEPDDRYVSLPAPVAAGVSKRYLGKSQPVRDQIGNLADGHVVLSGHVENVEAVPALVIRAESASTTSSTWMYDLLCCPSPRISKRVGSAE